MKKIVSVLLAVFMVFACVSFAFASLESLPFDNSEFFTCGDYTLHYRVYEAQGSEVNRIMLLHGFGLSTASLEGVAEEYAKNGYKTVLVDLPNFGYSSRENGKTALIDRETLVYELMCSFGGSWIIGGHSMGGGVAINIATEYPGSVSGLVLFAPQTSSQLAYPLNVFMKSAPMRLMYEILIGLASRMPSVLRLLVEMSFSDKDFAASYDISRIAKPLQIKGTGAGIAVMATHAKSTDFEAFSKLEIPVVMITASDDKIASAENLNEITENAPKETVIYNFEKGGHMMMEYSPVECVQKTLETVAKCA